MTRPSDKKKKLHSCPRSIGRNDLADQGRKTNLTPKRFSIHVTWRNTTWEQPTWLYRGSWCLVLLACHGWIKWWDNDGSGPFIISKPNAGSTSTHTKMAYPSGICHWNVNHLTNQAQISFHYECSRKTSTFQSFKKTPFKNNLILGFPWGRGEGRPQRITQMVLYQ